jgi:hypothetical protein
MAITFPRDFLTGFPGWNTEFKLEFRQDKSRSAGGTTYVKDMGTPIWRATYTTRVLSPNELDRWRAIIDTQDGGLNAFIAVPLSRCYPILYPNGSGLWATTWTSGVTGQGNISAIVTPNKEISISGLPVGYQASVGDMVRIGSRNLHRIVGVSGPASGAGVITVEIRPGLWPESAVGNVVYFPRPWCRMVVDPSSVSTTADRTTGRGTLSFDGWEYR